MSKKTAILNIGKAFLGVSFTTLAAIGGAWAGVSGNPLFAALLAGSTVLPMALLSASDTIKSQLPAIWEQDGYLKIPPPQGFSNTRDWENICAEIDAHLPHIVQEMLKRISQYQGVKTTDAIQQMFIEAVIVEPLTWTFGDEGRRKVAQAVVVPILQKISEILEPVIVQAQREDLLRDFRNTATNTKETVEVLKEIRDAGKLPSLTDAEIAAQRQQYCDALYEQYRMFDFKGIMHVEMNRPLSIPITEVFVFPDVLVGVPEYETMEREDTKSNKQLGEGRQDEQGDLMRRERDFQSARREIRVIQQRKTLKETLAVGRRFVILGDPGAGKSTFLRYLLLRLAENHEEFFTLFPQITLFPQPNLLPHSSLFPQSSNFSSIVPLYMPLAPYADFWQKSKSG
ncbi:MAG TPA: hypothetical protein VKR83_12050, partial [Ktedonobacteraceae bacterium]|nr:hypothetical protein [Ktedonobacteraceae bacterium]